jgi:hypothetical protein
MSGLNLNKKLWRIPSRAWFAVFAPGWLIISMYR